jgi:hypothetical protein
MSSRLIVPFDFCPNDTVAISGASYTVPAGKYGLFTNFTASASVTQANNLASGTYNVIPELELNSVTLPARSILRLQTQHSSTRTYRYTNVTSSQEIDRLSIRWVRVSGGISAAASSMRVYLESTGLASQYFQFAVFETSTAYSPPGIRRDYSVSTPVLSSGFELFLETSAANVGNFEICLLSDRWTESRWLRAGDILSSTNSGSVSALATIYNLVS